MEPPYPRHKIPSFVSRLLLLLEANAEFRGGATFARTRLHANAKVVCMYVCSVKGGIPEGYTRRGAVFLTAVSSPSLCRTRKVMIVTEARNKASQASGRVGYVWRRTGSQVAPSDSVSRIVPKYLHTIQLRIRKSIVVCTIVGG